jgi:threonine/homoserine/homoserine lactone efflux protein
VFKLKEVAKIAGVALLVYVGAEAYRAKKAG